MVYHEFDKREGMYTTLPMSTGLTFGSISALFGLTNKIIDQRQYTVLVTAVIGSSGFITVSRSLIHTQESVRRTAQHGVWNHRKN
jgi:hypothetical protein